MNGPGTLPPLRLREDTVAVWVADLDRAAAELGGGSAGLSPDELGRAARFQFREDRERYIAAHGVLRRLLGGYLGLPAASLEFGQSGSGKPGLAARPGAPRLEFNLSHSGSMALFGFSWGRQLGVDVERVRSDLEYLELAERFFAPSETAALRAQPAELQPHRFFRLWTLKEAYLKARGSGLAGGLEACEFAVDGTELPRLLRAPDDPDAASRWTTVSLEPCPGYVAAVVVEGAAVVVQPLQWWRPWIPPAAD